MNIVYFDLETQKSADEVGGWGNKHLMRCSIGVTYSTREGLFKVFEEEDIPALITDLASADQVVGYNIINFDYQVLSGYSSFDFLKLPTLDLMVDLQHILGFRPKLESVSMGTLNTPKGGDGLKAIRWFNEGNFAQVAIYCKEDVRITRDVHQFGCKHGFVYCTDRAGGRLSARVPWLAPPAGD